MESPRSPLRGYFEVLVVHLASGAVDCLYQYFGFGSGMLVVHLSSGVVDYLYQYFDFGLRGVVKKPDRCRKDVQP